MAGVKGLEPSTYGVTGRRSNQTELHPRCLVAPLLSRKNNLCKHFFYFFSFILKKSGFRVFSLMKS